MTVSATDASGFAGSVPMTLASFSTQGPAPARSVTGAPTVTIASTTEFVSRAGGGTILGACRGPAACRLVTTIRSGQTVIATSPHEFLGVRELGYLSYTLTAAGRALLAAAAGNQLPVTATLDNGSQTATGHVVLVAYG